MGTPIIQKIEVKSVLSRSINTLDGTFREDMDKAVSIQRRLAAMEAFHKAGVRTTCFISPIFPGITDVKAIIQQAKAQCNLIWLENLNLRGGYKAVIMDRIQEKYSDLLPLYQDIYNKNDRRYPALYGEENRQDHLSGVGAFQRNQHRNVESLRGQPGVPAMVTPKTTYAALVWYWWFSFTL